MIDDDELFDALAAEQRRRLLVDLLDGTPRRVPALSEAERELADADERLLQRCLADSLELAGTDGEALRNHYLHLPKLEGYDFLEWDRDAETVTTGARYEDARPILELLADAREESETDVPLVVPRR